MMNNAEFFRFIRFEAHRNRFPALEELAGSAATASPFILTVP
jgi:hypothetical protein